MDDRERELTIEVRTVEGCQFLPMTRVPESWRGGSARVQLVLDGELRPFPLGDDAE